MAATQKHEAAEEDVRILARRSTREAIRIVRGIMLSARLARDRLAAAELLLAYGHNRPGQSVELRDRGVQEVLIISPDTPRRVVDRLMAAGDGNRAKAGARR